ncbi:hypothetical protein BU15DRAFT_9434, partial [Melanogaster broomeanus]
STKQDRIEELLRKSLLGEELVNTQFHLFTARLPSPTSGKVQVVGRRVLCANNVLLTESSKYFLDCEYESSPDTVHQNGHIPSGTPMEEYGYESDSDLDDEEPPPPPPPIVAEDKAHAVLHIGEPSCHSPRPSSDAGSDSGASDTFVSDAGSDGGGLVEPEAKTDETILNSTSPSRTASVGVPRLRSSGNRHILVKDTAFQTWYTLLNYLYTGKITFLPPKSSCLQSERPLVDPKDEPKCSAKSMYRLACKLGLDDLRDVALASIRSNLTQNNILRELSCRLLARFVHVPLLEMELDVLHAHVASPSVVNGLPELAKRIANKDLPHGADIIIGWHTRILRQHYP